MTATALDSAIFRDIFTTPEMRDVFSDERRTSYYLEIERALARAQARLGIIPEKAAREIERQCRIENIDLARLKQQTERIGYPILGVVQQIVNLCADGLGEWCHWGATTRTSPTPRRSCRSAPPSNWWKRTWRRSPRRSPTFRGATAIRRWRAAATCS
ncbi:MAG: hypothetical protein ACXU87_02580, partial [Xanthobacteraceae bacterium]